MDLRKRVELGAIATGGAWSLGVLWHFATGKPREAYLMLAIGTCVATTLALVRTASEDAPPTAALPGGA